MSLFKKKRKEQIGYNDDIKSSIDSIPKLYVDIPKLKANLPQTYEFKIDTAKPGESPLGLFMERMQPLLVEAGAELKMPSKFGHVGYSFWKEWIDLDGNLILETPKFQQTLRKYLVSPYRKEGQGKLSYMLELLKFKLKKLLPFLGVMLISFNSMAQVTLVEKDAKAPYTGYIFSLESEKQNRLQLIEGDVLKRQLKLSEEISNLKDSKMSELENQVGMWRNQSDILSKELIEYKDNSFWKYTLYFLLGAAVTTGIAFGVNQATK